MTSQHSLLEDLRSARKYAEKFELEKATDILQNVLARSQAFGDSKVECDALCELGKITWSKGALNEAKEIFNKALQLAEKISYKYGKAFVLNYLGNIVAASQKEGAIHLSLELYNESLELRKEIDDLNGIGTCLNNMGNRYFDLGDFSKALDYFKESLEVKEKIQQNYGIALALNNMGEIHRIRGEAQEALKAYERARIIFIGMNNTSGVALTTQNVGLLYWGLGKYNKAESMLKESFDSWNELGISDKGVVENLAAIAGVLAEKGDYDESLIFLKQTEELAKSLQVPSGNLNWLLVSGIIARSQGNTATALKFFKSCLTEARRSNLFIYSVHALLQLAELALLQYKITLDDQNLNDANSYLEEVVSLAEVHKIPGILVETSIVRGMLEGAQMNYQEGIFIFKEAIESAKRLNLPRHKQRAETQLENLIRVQTRVKKMVQPPTDMEKVEEVREYLAKYGQILKGFKG